MTTSAILLAAGQGTRLRPLTDDRPKCMVPLLGKPLLEHQLGRFAQAPIAQVTIIGGYKASCIRYGGVRLIVNPDFATTNMVHTLFCAEELFDGSSDLVVSYGDIVFESRVLDSLLASAAPVSVAIDKNWRQYWQLRMADPLSDAETLILGEDGSIRELGKKPRSYDQIQGQYMGLIKIRKEEAPAVLEAYRRMDRSHRYEGADFRGMYMTSFIQHLIDSGWRVEPVETRGGWLEVDTLEDISLYERLAEEGRLDPFYRPG